MGKYQKILWNVICFLGKGMRRDEGNYLGCHNLCCTNFWALLHLFMLFSNSAYEQDTWTLLMKFDLPAKLLFPVNFQDHIAKESLCVLLNGLNLRRLGKF